MKFLFGERTVTVTSKQDVVRGSIGTTVEVEFASYWDEYDMTIVFARTDFCKPFFAIESPEVVIPWEIMNETGSFVIGAFGTKNGKLTPTLWSEAINILYGTSTTPPPPPTPSVYNEILSRANKALGEALNANRIAEAAQNTAATASENANKAYEEARKGVKAVAYDDYEHFIENFNEMPINAFKIANNVMIKTLDVPDIWISATFETAQPYTYTTDEAFVDALKSGEVQVGHYGFSMLETQKVDLTQYYTKNESILKFSTSGAGVYLIEITDLSEDAAYGNWLSDATISVKRIDKNSLTPIPPTSALPKTNAIYIVKATFVSDDDSSRELTTYGVGCLNPHSDTPYGPWDLSVEADAIKLCDEKTGNRYTLSRVNDDPSYPDRYEYILWKEKSEVLENIEGRVSRTELEEKTETWFFTLDDDTVVTKKVVVIDD